MSLFSSVKNSVQATVRSVQQTTVNVQAKAQEKVKEAPARARDTFEQSPRPKLALSTPGVSTQVRGETLGVSFKATDGAATLGALDFKAGGHELVLGLVPAAPAPLPMPVYSGPERK
ncbi:MAG: hypothetical protein Q8L48_29645 [Archangium sp.]|nr:hypothetical protein [Archangium sp.]